MNVQNSDLLDKIERLCNLRELDLSNSHLVNLPVTIKILLRL